MFVCTYVYTPPQGHHTPPIPWGGGNTGHGTIYVYTYIWDLGTTSSCIPLSHESRYTVSLFLSMSPMVPYGLLGNQPTCPALIPSYDPLPR